MEIDLHIHSRHSYDSNNSVREIIRRAKKAGLDGVAIVDHGNLGGGLEALALPEEEKQGLVIIAGMEIMTHYGDILGLFLSKPVRTTDPLEVIFEMKKQGGVVVLPHPFFSKLPQHIELLEHFDAIETCNGRHQLDSEMGAKKAQKHIEEFARKHGLAAVGGSDAHAISEIGSAATIAPAETAEDLKDAILRRMTAGICREPSRFRKFFLGP